MRLFWAVDVVPEFAAQLQALSGLLQRQFEDQLRWVAPANYHLTLGFLGDTAQERVSSLTEAVVNQLSDVTSFQSTVRSLAWFQSVRRPRVLVAEVIASSALVELQHRAAIGLNEAGISLEDRPYRPHISLARVRGQLNMPPEKELAVSPILFPVQSVSLYESKLHQKGAQYRALTTINLKA